ncbi:hypothetical protein HPB49_004780 [Dermacentor silvarum]|uniref:Uncharacterized protein n=1 Tax=Dermacentor silvarum TaxID=543639 RepID=A0ACB8C254_DERSI|nr:hypothetical protein HPB49_004780 [Dermacentor silvarum]
MMQAQVNGEDISPEEFLEGNGWCTIRYKTQSNRETAQNNNQNGAHSRTGEGANGNRQRPRQQQRNVKQQAIRNSKMPLLPRSYFKVVIRPRGDLDVATTGTVRLASAIYGAANVPAQEALENTVCSNNRQNIIVVSTPHATHAAKYRQLEAIAIGDRRHEVSAYETAPDYTVKGIIRGIPLEERAKSIHTNIVHGRNPHALAAKRLSNTKTVIMAFYAPRVPSYVRNDTGPPRKWRRPPKPPDLPASPVQDPGPAAEATLGRGAAPRTPGRSINAAFAATSPEGPQRETPRLPRSCSEATLAPAVGVSVDSNWFSAPIVDVETLKTLS